VELQLDDLLAGFPLERDRQRIVICIAQNLLNLTRARP
jgi:hypothetical protein